jgi:pimeloyl-ACP methyl ester carboxylesterase
LSPLWDFVPGRPPQPVDAFLSQFEAVLAYGAEAQLGRTVAPTLVTYGPLGPRHFDRFAPALTQGINGPELFIFEHFYHAGLHHDAEQINRVTLQFLTRQKL